MMLLACSIAFNAVYDRVYSYLLSHLHHTHTRRPADVQAKFDELEKKRLGK